MGYVQIVRFIFLFYFCIFLCRSYFFDVIRERVDDQPGVLKLQNCKGKGYNYMHMYI